MRALERTTHSIVHSDHSSPTRPKPLFPILAGLVAIRAGWQDGLRSSSFRKRHARHTGDQALSLGLALEDQAFASAYGTFDLTLTHGDLSFSDDACPLAWFLFTLLERLQDLGTCPAVDWLRYRHVLSVNP